MRVILILFVSFFWFTNHVFSQDADTTVKTKKPWYLNLNTDLKLNTVGGYYKNTYSGEYNKSGDPYFATDWVWKDTSETIKKLHNSASFYDVKMDVLLSRNRKMRGGLSYNFGIVDLRQQDSSNGGYYEYHRNLSFIAVTGLFEYAHYFKPGPVQNQPFVYGSIAGGFYRETTENGGPGREWFAEGRIGGGYHLKNDWMVRAWFAQNMLLYRYRSNSPIFNREQKNTIDMRLSYWGIGFSKQFELIPD